MTTSELTFRLNAEGDAAAELGKLDKKLGGVDKKMVAIGAGAAAIGLAVGKFVSEGISAYSEFENAISEINARTQLTEDEMEGVAAKAKQMGIETAFSATDSANAMLQLITSGSEAAEAIQLLPDVLNLAAASGLDLETSADALTDVMKQFGIGAEGATRVVDTLTAASQSSSATVADMIAAMANGGVVAAGYGISLEQTAAALAVIAENGVKGSEAGTQFKSMLVQANRGVAASEGALKQLGLALWGAEHGFDDYSDAAAAAAEQGVDLNDIAVTFFDAEGNAREFAAVMDEIGMGMALLTDEHRVAAMKELFGSYGQIAAGAINNADGIGDMVEAMQGQNSAAEVAEKRLESFEKRADLLGSSLEGLMIEVIGPLVEQGLKPLVEWSTNALNSFTLWVGEGDKAQVAMAGVMSVLGALGGIAGNIFGFISSVVQGDFAGAFEYAKGLVEQAMNYIEGILLTGVGTFLVIFAGFYGNLAGGALEGLDHLVKTFQTAFHFVKAFVHNFAIDIIGVVETMLNGILGAIEDFIRGALEPIAARAGTILDIGGLASAAKEFLEGFSLRVDLTSGLKRIDPNTYVAPGLGLSPNIREDISAGLRSRGQDLIGQGADAFNRAQNVQVTNVNVEIGNNVGDDDELIRMINQAVRTRRLLPS